MHRLWAGIIRRAKESGDHCRRTLLSNQTVMHLATGIAVFTWFIVRYERWILWVCLAQWQEITTSRNLRRMKYKDIYNVKWWQTLKWTLTTSGWKLPKKQKWQLLQAILRLSLWTTATGGKLRLAKHFAMEMDSLFWAAADCTISLIPSLNSSAGHALVWLLRLIFRELLLHPIRNWGMVLPTRREAAGLVKLFQFFSQMSEVILIEASIPCSWHLEQEAYSVIMAWVVLPIFKKNTQWLKPVVVESV